MLHHKFIAGKGVMISVGVDVSKDKHDRFFLTIVCPLMT